MNLAKDRQEKIIIALDSIRCDNREGKTISELRQMDDDIMEFIERKGYCKYVLGEGNVFIRTLTDKGYEVLGSGTYKTFLTTQKKEKFRLLMPIRISIFAFIVSLSSLGFGIYQFKKTSELNKTQLENTITHNKLSVRPFLNIETNISATYPKISITLQNKGIGPALIIDQKITYNGIPVNNWSSLTEIIEKDKLIFWKKYVPEWYDLNHLILFLHSYPNSLG